jgi:glycerol-3-phosphate dehydrogenase (NAD(P)+)
MAGIGRIGILGGGAWGTALAQAARRAGLEVQLWARDAATVHAIRQGHHNPRYLPGQPLDPLIRATTELDHLRGADLLLLALPAQEIRGALRLLPERTPLVIAAKGFERSSGLRLSQVAAEERPLAPVLALSGPSFAREVAAGQPTAVTIAGADPELARSVALALGSATFRCYWSRDLAGVEVGGAVKNVLAIACGVVMGRGLGENARAALIARGLAELTRLGTSLGGEPATLAGLSGLGDLVLTCTSLTSRNTAFGHALARSDDPRRRPGGPPALAEGVFTAAAVVHLADRLGLEVPISRAVYAVLEGADIDRTIEGLLARAPRTELPEAG